MNFPSNKDRKGIVFFRKGLMKGRGEEKRGNNFFVTIKYGVFYLVKTEMDVIYLNGKSG